MFVDHLENEWKVNLTVGKVRRLRNEKNIDFLGAETTGVIMIETDEECFLTVLEFLLSEQLKERGVKFDELIEDMPAETYEYAKLEVRRAISFFYQKCGPERMILYKAIRQNLGELIKRQAEAVIHDQLDQNDASGNSSGEPQGTSE